MPCLKILTNLSHRNVPHDFVNKIVPLLSKVVNKPADKIICVMSTSCAISFGGENCEPGAVATLESIGNLGLQENKLITKEISAFLETELGIPQKNFFLTFYDMKPQDTAKGGDTLA